MNSTYSQIMTSIMVGLLIQVLTDYIHSNYLMEFYENNLVTILISLLAINSATMSIVLSKVRELIDNGGSFDRTKKEMQKSILQQIVTIVISLMVLVLLDTRLILEIDKLSLGLKATLHACFIFALINLYDNAKTTFIIIDIKTNK